MKNFYFLLFPILFCSCAKNLTVNYQTETGNTGTVVLRPSSSTDKTNVTMNDNLLVKRKYVKSVTIKNVPYGDHVITYASDASGYKDKLNEEIKININSNKEVTKLVAVPPHSTGYWLYAGLAFIPVIVLIAL